MVIHMHTVHSADCTFFCFNMKTRSDFMTFPVIQNLPTQAFFFFFLQACSLLLKFDRCGSNNAFYKSGLLVYSPTSSPPEGFDGDDSNPHQPFNDG